MVTTRRTKPRKDTNIRDKIIIDVVQFVNNLQQQKHAIIIGIDTNEVNDRPKNGEAKLLYLINSVVMLLLKKT